MEKGAFLSLVLRSLRDFQDKDLAEIIISLMCKRQKFSPDVYDYYEPLKKTFDINCMPDMVEVWMNSDKNNQNFEREPDVPNSNG